MNMKPYSTVSFKIVYIFLYIYSFICLFVYLFITSMLKVPVSSLDEVHSQSYFSSQLLAYLYQTEAVEGDVIPGDY